jgi:DNA-binding IclR family transcriptional regulator
MPAKRNDVKSSSRTLEILEFFAETHSPASVSEVARALHYPQSSASVLLNSLAQLGYLEQDPQDRRYQPTLRVMLLGGWLQDRLIGGGNLLRLMEALRTRSRCTVLIGMQRDLKVQYILTLRRSSQPGELRAGMMRPIERAAVGKALLMLKSDAEAARILRSANAKEPDPARRLRIADAMAELRLSRSRGWTESNGAVMAGQTVLAMPLPQLPGHPPMAIGLGTDVELVERGRASMLKALRKVCAGPVGA